ncbi:hypothetical protein BDZ85DRAFT_319999 [Elsinoe ampelina]|uniref:Uncharacterized protein n=1 Tax=Elsinoe ampelina TaxID=302913 RepID=A0A6A6G7D3_9PEZI|nr:hypothetical protein BDZ85DRAFT_319999 [Elsinoe ampelina]
MAPNRALQAPRSDPSKLSNNRRTAIERNRRNSLSKTQADYERQKKADREHLDRYVKIFKLTDTYLKAPTDNAKKLLVDAEKQRLSAVRIIQGNHHSLLATEFRGKGRKYKHVNSWRDVHAGEDEAPNMKVEEEQRQLATKKELDETERRTKAKIKTEKSAPKIKQEPKDDDGDDDKDDGAWVLGNTHPTMEE